MSDTPPQPEPTGETAPMPQPLPLARRVERPRSVRRARHDPDDRPPAVETRAHAHSPGALLCLRVFCAFICLVAVAGAVALVLYAGEQRERGSASWAGNLFALILPLSVFALFIVPLWARTPRPWVWWYGLVLLLLSLFTLYFTILALPLLVGWVMPGVQAYFGRGLSPRPSEVHP